jgi:hypothetical protein
VGALRGASRGPFSRVTRHAPCSSADMAGLRLDGAGQAKMKTLEEALALLLRVNGLVEQYALQLKRNQPTNVYVMNIRRQLPTLAEKLKGQFGMISDQATQMNLASSRGASEQMRVRALREGVAQIKTALEIAVAHVKDKHELKDEKKDAAAER